MPAITRPKTARLTKVIAANASDPKNCMAVISAEDESKIVGIGAI
jgi:hypothetical protein